MVTGGERHIVTVVGARPQFVKAAVLSRLFARDGHVRESIVHTGQHFDAGMSGRFFEELGIPAPVANLHVSGLPHGAMTGRMLEGIEAVLNRDLPDAVLVYGDTNSTLAGALAAAKLHIPVIRVEAGLRSFNRRMPEEVNRVLSDHLGALLLCPTERSVRNLADEGITEGVHHVGDVMFDATRHFADRAAASSDVLARLGLTEREYALATVHRAENTDDPDRLAEVMAYVAATPSPVILPVHPRTRGALAAAGWSDDRVRLIDPVGYLDMHRLLSGAAAVLTDSGGLQKEAYFHGVPCVTLRDETEWIETVDAGWNRLWRGPDYHPRRAIEDYGNGDAGQRCLDAIRALVA